MMYQLKILFPAIKKSLLGLFLLCMLISLNTYASGKFNTQKRYLYVQPGQSIFSIVKVLYPEQQEQWPAIIKKVVRKNPHAFIAADPIKILSGERIELPAISEKHKHSSAVRPAVYKRNQAVGQVIKKKGKTFVISKKHTTRDLHVGSEIFVGDRIFTGVNGFIRLNMIDEAKIDLRCNSEMLIEDYQLLRGGNRSVIYLIKGSVKKITGTIGKLADDIYEMHTPLATVGVRGTEYAIRVLQQYGCDGSLDVNSKGLFVKVNRGGIDITTETEEHALEKDEAAHLESADDELERIDASEGVFDAVDDTEKSHFLGAAFWLICLIPLLTLLRKIRSDGS